MRKTTKDTALYAGERWQVFLSGEPVAHCTAFDTDEGWVERHVTRPDGQFVIADSCITVERLSGDVTATQISPPDYQRAQADLAHLFAINTARLLPLLRAAAPESSAEVVEIVANLDDDIACYRALAAAAREDA